MNQQVADMLRWRAGHLEDDIEDAEAKERGERTLMDRATSVFGFESADEFYLTSCRRRCVDYSCIFA